jgi:hypothetical protein
MGVVAVGSFIVLLYLGHWATVVLCQNLLKC